MENVSLENNLVKIAKGAGILLIGILISKILGYVYLLIAARTGAEQFGLLALGLAIVGIFAMISSLGLNLGVLRYVSFYLAKKDEKKARSIINYALKVSIPISILFSLLLFIFSKDISIIIFHNIKLSPILKILSFVVLIDTIRNILLAVLQATKKIKYIVYVKNITENGSKLLLTIIFIYLGLGIIGLSLAYTLSFVISCILIIYLLNKKVFPLFKKINIKSKSLGKEIFIYSWPLMLSGLLARLTTWTDTLMIGYFKKSSDVGIYNAAQPTAEILLITSTMLLILFVPIITGLIAEKKKKEIKDIYRSTTKWIFFINFPIFLLLIVFSKDILRILFSSPYVVGSLALSILAIGYLFNSIFFTSRFILDSIKRTKLILLNTIIVTVVNILLNYHLIPIYGIVGGAIATTSSLILFSILCWIETHRIIKIQPINFTYLKSIIAGFISVIIVYYLAINLLGGLSIFMLIFVGILALIIYLVLIILFKSFDENDLMIANAIERKLGLKFSITDKIGRYSK